MDIGRKIVFLLNVNFTYLPAYGATRIFLHHLLGYFDCRNLLNEVGGHGRRPRAVHLVEQLRDDGVQAAAAPGVVPGVAVQLEAALARPDKVEPCPAPATAAPWPEGGVVHPCEVEDEVLNK